MYSLSLVAGSSSRASVWLIDNTFHITFFFAFVIALYLLYRMVYKSFLYPFCLSPLRHLPGPKDNVFYLGQSPKVVKVSWLPELFCAWAYQWPEAPLIRYLNFGNSETLLASSVEAFKDVLQIKYSSFVKPSFARDFVSEFAGVGLPFVEGHVHHYGRAALSRMFSTVRLQSLFPFIQTKASRLAGFLREARNPNGEVEVESAIWRTVFDIIVMETLSMDIDLLNTREFELFDCIQRMMTPSFAGHVANYFNSIIPIRRYLPFRVCQDFTRDSDKVREIIRGYVRDRTKANQKATESDALQALLDCQDMTFKEDTVVEFMLNLLVLGHDTTACSLTWAIHELSRSREIQDRLRNEVAALYEAQPRPSYAEINKLPFMSNVVRETLRLYTAVAMSPREATEDVTISGQLVPKGTIITLSPAVINLHPTVWGPTANTFDPDRWDNLQGAAAGAYAFEAFHNGPRMCIGKQLSIIEMKAMLAEIVRHFRIEAVQETVLVAKPTLTLRPRDKLQVRLVEV